MTERCTITMLALLLTALPAASQLVPLGPEFRINTADLQALEAPAVALDGSGRLLAAWPTPGNTGNSIRLRLVERNGAPAGPETTLPTAGVVKDHPAAIALSPSGFALAWENLLTEAPHVLPRPGVGSPYSLSLRLLDAAGAAVGQEVQIDNHTSFAAAGVRLAQLSSGEIVATWDETRQLLARRFGMDGRPVTAQLELATLYDVIPGALANDTLGAREDGSFVAIWESDLITPPPPSQLAGRYDMAGQPLGSAFSIQDGKVAFGRYGLIAVAHSTPSPGDLTEDGFDVWLDFYDNLGRLLGASRPVAVGPGAQVVQALAADEAGRMLVVWSNEVPGEDHSADADLWACLLSSTGVPLGPPIAVATVTAGDQLGVKVAERDGEWVIAWVNEPPGAIHGGNHYARRFTSCATDGPSLCTSERFQAEVTWRIPGTGQTGTGQAVALTADTGAFWFFSSSNPELLVKVLDGRALNDHFWVFYGALSNVEYDLTVTDTVTGESKVYHNPAGKMASRADIRAFQDPGPPPPATAVSLGPPESTALEPPFGCAPMPGFPCLHGGRFSVDVTWRIPGTGQTGSGQEIGLTSDSSYLWFFDKDNVELVVKILDGTAVNGKFWVFYGALSDVEYTIRVTDHTTGKVKTYHNPAGTMASRADTSAF